MAAKNKLYQFNNCLRKYRKASGLKQKDVARILGIKSIAMISRWEKGKCMPDCINMFKLAVLYQTMADALFIDLVRALREEIAQRESVADSCCDNLKTHE